MAAGAKNVAALMLLTEVEARRLQALGTHNAARASHDCRALRIHNGAQDRGGPMPPSALGVENCMVLW